MSKKYFGTDGIRGKVNKGNINGEMFFKFGLAAGTYFKNLSGKNDSKERIGGTVSSCLFAMLQGVQILRVHDPNEINQGLKVFKSLIMK